MKNPANAKEFPVLKGEYLGQAPPGLTPQVFAPGVIPTENILHCFPTFSLNGREVYWMTVPAGSQPRIMFVKQEKGQWLRPQIAPFSGEYSDHCPVFSPDGKRLYFSSNRPGGHGSRDIWFVERTDAGWSEPENLGCPPNSDKGETQPTFTQDGTLYFTDSLEGAQYGLGIYRSRLMDGRYSESEALGELINTEHLDYTPFIAPDESYLLFSSGRPGSYDSESDIYISFHKSDGSWTNPQNMGQEINNGFTATFPYVSLDGKYLFFNRFNESETDVFYWVDSGIIEQFRPNRNR